MPSISPLLKDSRPTDGNSAALQAENNESALPDIDQDINRIYRDRIYREQNLTNKSKGIAEADTIIKSLREKEAKDLHSIQMLEKLSDIHSLLHTQNPQLVLQDPTNPTNLQKQRDRYQTCLDLQAQLRAIEEKISISQQLPKRSTQRELRKQRKQCSDRFHTSIGYFLNSLYKEPRDCKDEERLMYPKALSSLFNSFTGTASTYSFSSCLADFNEGAIEN